MKTYFLTFPLFISLFGFAQQNPAIYLPCNGNAGDSNGNGNHGVTSSISYNTPYRFNYPNKVIGDNTKLRKKQ